jgi:hypothetical protein
MNIEFMNPAFHLTNLYLTTEIFEAKGAENATRIENCADFISAHMLDERVHSEPVKSGKMIIWLGRENIASGLEIQNGC